MQRIMQRIALVVVTFGLAACSGERLTGPAAENAVRQYQSAAVAPANAPLILLDGKEISAAEVRALDSKTIESVQVFKKGRADTKQFGQRGTNGVVVIQRKLGAATVR